MSCSAAALAFTFPARPLRLCRLFALVCIFCIDLVILILLHFFIIIVIVVVVVIIAASAPARCGAAPPLLTACFAITPPRLRRRPQGRPCKHAADAAGERMSKRCKVLVGADSIRCSLGFDS